MMICGTVGRSFAELAVSFSQHPDEYRPERPVLLAVDQQFGEGGRVLLPLQIVQHQPSQGTRFHVVPSYATLTIQDPVVKSCGDARVSRRCVRVMTGSSVSVSPPVTV